MRQPYGRRYGLTPLGALLLVAIVVAAGLIAFGPRSAEGPAIAVGVIAAFALVMAAMRGPFGIPKSVGERAAGAGVQPAEAIEQSAGPAEQEELFRRERERRERDLRGA